jgi:hypothetical protein
VFVHVVGMYSFIRSFAVVVVIVVVMRAVLAKLCLESG